MKPWPKWLRWAWILPVGELLLAGAVAGPQAVHMMRNPPRLCRTADGQTIVDPSDPRGEQLLRESDPGLSSFKGVYVVSLPGALIEAVTEARNWPDPYRPLWAWPIGIDGFRALIWPLYALPFWFFAGRGLDSLLGNSRISALEASLMMGFGLLVAVASFGFAVTFVHSGLANRKITCLSLISCLMWFAFCAVCTIAKARQRTNYFA